MSIPLAVSLINLARSARFDISPDGSSSTSRISSSPPGVIAQGVGGNGGTNLLPFDEEMLE